MKRLFLWRQYHLPDRRRRLPLITAVFNIVFRYYSVTVLHQKQYPSQWWKYIWSLSPSPFPHPRPQYRQLWRIVNHLINLQGPLPKVKYGVRSPTFFWAPCVQMYWLVEAPQIPPPPLLRGRYWSAKIDDISLKPPGLYHALHTVWPASPPPTHTHRQTLWQAVSIIPCCFFRRSAEFFSLTVVNTVHKYIPQAPVLFTQKSFLDHPTVLPLVLLG
jgi:hypothetical protein